jgi:RNA polymerase sigma-70 factor (ECF subfamily)
MNDEQLVVALAAQQPDALGVLYDRYGAACYALAKRIVVDEMLAQDVVQEVLLAVWGGSATYQPDRGALSTWLLTLTHHKAVDVVRREQRHRLRRADLGQLDTTVSPDPPVDEQAAIAVRRSRVRAALGSLPDSQREVLLLAYFGGYTQSEIAQLTGTPLGTVKTRTSAAVRRLRRLLDGLAAEHAGEEAST